MLRKTPLKTRSKRLTENARHDTIQDPRSTTTLRSHGKFLLAQMPQFSATRHAVFKMQCHSIRDLMLVRFAFPAATFREEKSTLRRDTGPSIVRIHSLWTLATDVRRNRKRRDGRKEMETSRRKGEAGRRSGSRRRQVRIVEVFWVESASAAASSPFSSFWSSSPLLFLQAPPQARPRTVKMALNPIIVANWAVIRLRQPRDFWGGKLDRDFSHCYHCVAAKVFRYNNWHGPMTSPLFTFLLAHRLRNWITMLYPFLLFHSFIFLFQCFFPFSMQPCRIYFNFRNC